MDPRRAVEIFSAAAGPGDEARYGSGYGLGAGLILTAAHVLPDAGSEGSVTIRAFDHSVDSASIVWRSSERDLAIVRLAHPDVLPSSTVAIAELSADDRVRVPFEMYGWPRAGSLVTADGHRLRDPVHVVGEVRLTEFAGSRSRLMRLRPEERFPPASDGSYWQGMSGAAVHCDQRVVAVQVSQANAPLTSFISARPLSAESLGPGDDGTPAVDILASSGIRFEMAGPRVSRGARRIFAARPYVLLEIDQIVGRAELKATIASFLGGDGGNSRMLILLGAAGVGKSALSWDAWRTFRDSDVGRLMFWYSFYDGRGVGSFAGFREALAAFLELPEDASVESLLEALSHKPALLFLDGLERCLRCFQRPLGLGDVDAMRAEHRGRWTDTDLRFAADDAYRFFLQLLESENIRALASSRVLPSDLVASGGVLRPGVTAVPVSGLAAPETYQFLCGLGLEVDRRAAWGLTNSLGGHPFALQVLARRARDSIAARRNLTTWLASEGFLRPDGRGSGDVRDQLLANSARRLSAPARMALTAVGALGGSADAVLLYDVLEGAAVQLDDAVFRQTVEEIRASMLGLETADGQIACHPLAALAAADQLGGDDSRRMAKAITAVMRGRFEATADDEPLRSLDSGYYKWAREGRTSDRVEVMALCNALVRLGSLEEAATLYIDELDKPIRQFIGANSEAVELLRLLTSAPTAEVGDNRSSVLKTALAYHLLMVGRIDEAAETLSPFDPETESFDSLRVRSEIELHRDNLSNALIVSAHALARSTKAMDAFEPSALGMLLGVEALYVDLASSVLSATTSCARILIAGEESELATALLTKGFRLHRATHSQCHGCLAKLVGVAAEILTLCDRRAVAVTAADFAEQLAAAEGRPLLTLPSRITMLIRQRLATDDPQIPPAGIIEFLSDQSFILYRLLLDAARASDGSEAGSAALAELESIGAGGLMNRMRNDDSPPEFRHDSIAYCHAWANDGGYEWSWMDHRNPTLSTEQQQTLDDIAGTLPTE